MDFRFVWAKNFNPKIKRMLKNAQNYVDTQCVEKMTPFVPVAPARFRNSGKLRNSVKIKKAGTITYTAPHSRYVYYATTNHKNGGNTNAKRMWFEVMKTKYRNEILRGLSEITKGNCK